jgi:hypothetical protein
MKKHKLEILIVLISNLFPLYGLFYLNWSPFNTSLIFIIETLIGLFFLEFKIITKAFNKIFTDIVPGLIIIFPIIIFSTLQTGLSAIMFATTSNQLYWHEIISITYNSIAVLFYGIILIFIRYLSDFIYYIKNKDYLKKGSLKKYGTSLTLRLFMMQFTVIIGGMIGRFSNNMTLGVSVLILIQIFLNLKYYFKNILL